MSNSALEGKRTNKLSNKPLYHNLCSWFVFYKCSTYSTGCMNKQWIACSTQFYLFQSIQFVSHCFVISDCFKKALTFPHISVFMNNSLMPMSWAETRLFLRRAERNCHLATWPMSVFRWGRRHWVHVCNDEEEILGNSLALCDFVNKCLSVDLHSDDTARYSCFGKSARKLSCI